PDRVASSAAQLVTPRRLPPLPHLGRCPQWWAVSYPISFPLTSRKPIFMRKNPVKAKLREGKPTFGTWLSLGDLYATRVLARMGWDWLTLDIEHSAIDWSQATMLFGAIADAGCVPLARVPE